MAIGDGGEEAAVVALSESAAQAWREKESRGRGGGGWRGSSPFIVAEGVGRPAGD
jgi:hypothetical protein